MKYLILIFFYLSTVLASGQKTKIVNKKTVTNTSWKNKYESITEKYYQDYSLVVLNGKYGFVNKNGIVTTPIIYDYLYGNVLGLSGAEITNENGVRLKGYVEIKSGKVVIPLLYNNSYHERNGIFYAEKNGEVHRYNSTGKCIEGCTNNNTNQVLASSAKKTPTNSTKTNSKSKIAAVKKSATKNANSNTGKICDEALVIYNEWKKNQFSNNYFFESNGYKYSFSKIKYNVISPILGTLKSRVFC